MFFLFFFFFFCCDWQANTIEMEKEKKRLKIKRLRLRARQICFLRYVAILRAYLTHDYTVTTAKT